MAPSRALDPPIVDVGTSSTSQPLFFSFLNLVAAGYEVAFIHPKSAAGVLVELVQAPADVVKALS